MNRSMALIDWAVSQPHKDCMVTEEARYSFADLGSAVVPAATVLADRVGIWTPVGLFIDSTPDFFLYEDAALFLRALVPPLQPPIGGPPGPSAGTAPGTT